MITGLGLEEVFTRIEGTSTRHLADALGSTLALSDPAGIVQTQYIYAPFGATTACGPTDTNPFSSRDARTTAPGSTTTERGTTTQGSIAS